MTERQLALVVGANRGIGLGVVTEFLDRGWDVIATAREPEHASALHALAAQAPDRLTIVKLEMNDPAELDGFAAGIDGRILDIVLINAGISGPEHRSASMVTSQEIGSLMFTNAIAPIRLARTLIEHLRADRGVLAFTSSVMGSVALNAGGHELYRASKATLNLLTRGLYAELKGHEPKGRNLTVLSLHPGWVRTDMTGPEAAVSVADSAQGLVSVMLKSQGAHSHQFIDYQGKEIPW